MPLIEDAKAFIEHRIGWKTPPRAALTGLIRARKPVRFAFKDDGEIPKSRWPLLVYRGAVKLDPAYDPAAIFEALFARHGWRGSWRDGMYDWLHYHSNTHEVLGVARGTLTARFGGRHGRAVKVKAGDVIVLPAGVGHCRLRASRELLIVGAYPGARQYDECEPKDTDDSIRCRIARVPLPRRDPVHGAKGPLFGAWRTLKS